MRFFFGFSSRFLFVARRQLLNEPWCDRWRQFHSDAAKLHFVTLFFINHLDPFYLLHLASRNNSSYYKRVFLGCLMLCSLRSVVYFALIEVSELHFFKIQCETVKRNKLIITVITHIYKKIGNTSILDYEITSYSNFNL